MRDLGRDERASSTLQTLAVVAAFVASLSLVAACGSSARRNAAASSTAPTNPPATTASTTSTTSTTAAPATTTLAPPPPFSYSIGNVTAADLPYSWRPGCPLGPDQLRVLHLSYWGFDSQAHTGSIVVAASVTGDVLAVFRRLYDGRFPIYEMVPVDAYGGDDNRAAAADDTSGFNCRYAVTNPPSRQWSVHSMGEAIDVNDVQNPYVDGSTIIPPAGSAYLNRSDVRPGMAEPGGVLVQAFAAVGWFWGGRWSPGVDYQHFSKTGG